MGQKRRILILGGSGFLGHTIYKTLSPFYNTFGTYFSQHSLYSKNSNFFQFSLEHHDISTILDDIKPTLIISALRGPFPLQLNTHKKLFDYTKRNVKLKVVFLSSANVFDAYSKYPSYELDTTLSHSIFGHFKIKIEQLLLKLPKKQTLIIRLPMVFGSNSPRVKEIKQQQLLNEAIELFPNLVMSVCSNKRLAQQLHYMINRDMYGIFHCSSNDLVHHEDFIKDLTRHLKFQNPKFKMVYTTNDLRYLAVLPKYNTLPKHLLFDSQSIFDEIITSI